MLDGGNSALVYITRGGMESTNLQGSIRVDEVGKIAS